MNCAEQKINQCNELIDIAAACWVSQPGMRWCDAGVQTSGALLQVLRAFLSPRLSACSNLSVFPKNSRYGKFSLMVSLSNIKQFERWNAYVAIVRNT